MKINISREVIISKIKLIYAPFFIIAIAFILTYTAFNWYLIAKSKSLREDTVNFWLPFTLPWIPLIIWLRPRLKLLNLKRKKGDLPTFYLIIAGFTIIAPTIIAEEFLTSATGKLTRLHDINQIHQSKSTKYYSVHNYFIDTRLPGIYYTSKVSGRYNTRLDLYIYIACPIYDRDISEVTKIGTIAPPIEKEKIKDSLQYFESNVSSPTANTHSIIKRTDEIIKFAVRRAVNEGNSAGKEQGRLSIRAPCNCAWPHIAFVGTRRSFVSGIVGPICRETR
jgi:hypothetical protein